MMTYGGGASLSEAVMVERMFTQELLAAFLLAVLTITVAAG